MGTEVLLPHDSLIERIRAPPASFSRRKPYGNCCNNYNYVNNYGNYYGNNSNNSYGATNSGRINRKPVIRPEQRKRTAVTERRHSSSCDDLKVARGSGMVMEKVMILRRGESLDSIVKSDGLKKEGENLVVVGTQRLGPDPTMVPKQIRIVDFKSGCDVYAGSAFAMSPSPSALPIPSFQRKFAPVAVDDSATRDLRRLLRIA